MMRASRGVASHTTLIELVMGRYGMHAEGAVDARSAGLTTSQRYAGILSFTARSVLRPFGFKPGFDPSIGASAPTGSIDSMGWTCSTGSERPGLRHHRRQATGEAAA